MAGEINLSRRSIVFPLANFDLIMDVARYVTCVCVCARAVVTLFRGAPVYLARYYRRRRRRCRRYQLSAIRLANFPSIQLSAAAERSRFGRR